jgi:catechol 2,3-dioxygenase-like lactoylglutathione lyase family enzyme
MKEIDMNIAQTKFKKVAHVVLAVRDLERSIAFYTEALGMELVKAFQEPQMAFFSFGEHDHDIAVVKVPDGQPVGSSGVAHTALEIAGGEDELRALVARLRAHGAHLDFAANHVIAKSAYFLDPDGNRLEIFSKEMTSADAKQYLHDARSNADVFKRLDLSVADARAAERGQ